MKITEIPVRTKGNPLGLYDAMPNGYDGIKKYSALVWLHGLGEVGPGSDGSLDEILQKTIMNWLKTNEVDFIVLAPQDPSGYWSSLDGFCEWALKTYAIDEGSLHLAGLSSGGYGLRDFIKRGSEVYKKFSTFTPMSTNLQDIATPVHLQKIVANNQKVWCHQGEVDRDPNAVYACGNFVKAGRLLDANRFHMTEYKGVGHSAWDLVYNSIGRSRPQLTTYNGLPLKVWRSTDPDWFQWLEANRKTPKVPVGPPVEPPVPVREEIKDQYFLAGKLIIEGINGSRKEL
jgi:hypothetical protein